MKYLANLHRNGAFPTEEIVTLALFSKNKSWSKVKTEILNKNIYLRNNKKRSTTIFNEIKIRYTSTKETLPSLKDLSLIIAKDIPAIAKKQIIFPYFLHRENLVESLLLHRVIPRVEETVVPVITKELVVEWIRQEAEDHPELDLWSASVLDRWIKAFLAALRQYDFLTPFPYMELKIPPVRLECFAFYLFDHFLNHHQISELQQLMVWKYFGLTQDSYSKLLYSLKAKQWLEIETYGEIQHFNIKYKNLNEWIQNGLG